MNNKFNIAALVDDLEPVKPLSLKWGWLLPGLLTIMSITFVIGLTGVRADLAAGTPHPMFLIRAGILLLLGGACGTALLAMASPSVGKHGNGWKIAVAAALIFPLAATVILLSGQSQSPLAATESGLRCLGYSIVAGGATAAPMVAWLRRGAPTSPERAGWLTGLAAGGLGAFAYNFHCGYNSIVYIGFWYSIAVAICGIAGRLVVPKLIRW
jgi:hypothetical protein